MATTVDTGALSVLRCPYCHSGDLTAHPEKLVCNGCQLDFPIVAGVVNALVKPSPDVAQEIRGMMEESPRHWDNLNDFIIHRVDRIATQEERKELSRRDRSFYHVSTEQHLHQFLELITITPGSKVLEIGGHEDYPFLVPFRDAGCECYETNILFTYDDNLAYVDWPVKVAGDLCSLPYKDDVFDIVFASATTHHIADLDTAIRELARVTKPGGHVLILNDPIGAPLKHLLDSAKERESNRGRNELIHENEYSIQTYMKLFRRHGLDVVAKPFPAYYESRLNSMDTAGVRLGLVARIVARLWKIGPLRHVLKTHGYYWGQRIIGLQMNVLLRKRG